ncbi:NUDIX hydrolase [Rhizobium mongolense]|uniref:NUDIX hydrolase n=1 Tax=Rhizobium mongolense TaxID=57676 RepID=UPI0034A576B2
MSVQIAMKVVTPASGFESAKSLARPALIEQAGAICLREIRGQERVEVLLVRSLRNGRWGIPKGHVEPGETSREAAQREAFEEAGVKGAALEALVKSYIYAKDGSPFRYRVAVHLIHVSHIEREFPEKGRRKTKWLPIDIACQEVAQRALRQIMRDQI